jgi:hypothetical protein
MAKGGEPTGPLTPQQRQQFVFERRRAAAQTGLNDAPPLPATNGDEERYLDRRAGPIWVKRAQLRFMAGSSVSIQCR